MGKLIIDAVYNIDNTENIKKFGGTIYYVSYGDGDDSNPGTNPDAQLKTIGAGISAMSAGDALNIKAGTYTETGLDLNKNNCELWCEIGVVLDGTGTCLTISGNDVKLNNEGGSCKITPASGQKGVVITGTNFQAHNVRVNCASNDSDNSWDISGAGAQLRLCKASGMGAGKKGFNATGAKPKLNDCGTIGTTTSYGFHLDGGTPWANGHLFNCTSAGHQSGGFYAGIGVSGVTFLNCSSGAGDGKWRDIDDANVWSNFSYEDKKYATQTFAGGGGGSTNLWKVTGAVEIIKIFGHVTTELSADVDNIHLEFGDGTGDVDITTAVDVSSAPVGSFLTKNDENTKSLVYTSSANAAILEAHFLGLINITFILLAQAGATNHIKSVYSGVATSGVIHWHVEYRPLTDDGFLEPA